MLGTSPPLLLEDLSPSSGAKLHDWLLYTYHQILVIHGKWSSNSPAEL